jgi:hypothetical protein
MSKPKNIYYMKLSNGDDIICDVLQDAIDESAYIVRLPMQVNYDFAPEVQRMFMGLSKWIPLMKSPTLVIYYDHVVTIAECSDEMVHFYHEALEKYEMDDDFFESSPTTAFENSDDIDDDKIKMAMYLANTSTTLN